MKPRTRVEQALAGRPVDRLPWSAWRHFPAADRDELRVVEVTRAWTERLGIDLVKTMPHGLFSVEDEGGLIDYDKVEPERVAVVVKPAVESRAGWSKIRGRDVTVGALGRELRIVGALRQALPDVVLVVTVFSPTTTGWKLRGPEVLTDLREAPQTVRPALEAITETTAAFTRRALAAGADGIFFATQLARDGMLSEAEYRELALPHDLEVLRAASTAWCNVLHLHGEGVHVSLVGDCAPHAVSYHVWETPPDPAEVLARFPCALLGGLRRNEVSHGSPDEVRRDFDAVMKATGGRRLILAPACVLPFPVTMQNLAALQEMVRS
ncbi:MAG: hypothetical protein HY660_13475 [Armatimonadetes bacterium]|nr:hypothetical protein [Armatimonadota bacterium]